MTWLLAGLAKSWCEAVAVAGFVLWSFSELFWWSLRRAHKKESKGTNRLPAVIHEQERQELLAIFQRSSEEIVVVKRLQWNGVYYAMAIDVALVGAMTQFNSVPPPWIPSMLIIAAIVTGALTVFFQRRVLTDLEKYRDRIERIIQMLGTSFEVAWGQPSDRDEKRRFVWMFYAVIFSATVVTALLICTIRS